MKFNSNLVSSLVFGLAISSSWAQKILTAGPIQFTLIEIEATKFVGEGIATGDADNDGDRDVFAGDYWYENPGKTFLGTWTKREIRPPNNGGNQDVTGYSNCHGVYTGDFNGDGFVDCLVVPFHGRSPAWYENPNDKTKTRWVEHNLGYDYGIEQFWFIDINGSGKKSLVTANIGDHSWGYWTPDATGKFIETKITGRNAPRTGTYDHGMGVSDLNGDGKLDVIHQQGWYENPGNSSLWKFHPDKFNNQPLTEPSTLWSYDFDKDGLTDIATASSHFPGVWWFKQISPGKWQEYTINDKLNTNHSIVMADMDLDGYPDIISGKRYYAHISPEDGAPVGLYWFKVTPGATPKFDLNFISQEKAGVGTQFEVGDMNGDNFPDIAVSNKSGIKIYLQVPRVVTSAPALQTLRMEKGRNKLEMNGANLGVPFNTGSKWLFLTINGRNSPVLSKKITP